MKLKTWLSEQRKLEQAASHAPWEYKVEMGAIGYVENSTHEICENPVTEDAQFIATSRNNYAKLLDAVEMLSATCEFYAAALEAKHDGIIPERIINGGEYIQLGTEAKETLASVERLLIGEGA